MHASLNCTHPSLNYMLKVRQSYYGHPSKTFADFNTVDTKGLKLLKNIKTSWISCLPPLRWLMSEYKSIMAKMHEDETTKNGGKWLS